MSTSQQFLLCDSSTLANFKQWAQAISAFFATATWTQSTDTGQVNWGTIASVPGSGAFVYEIWQPNDGLTNFYVKVEYGNVSGTNCPSLRLTLSTATNGAGTATGFLVGPYGTNTQTFTVPSATTQFECDFSGAAGRIGVMLWRNGTNNCQQMFAIERSVNSSGVYTGTYATLWVSGLSPQLCAQQSLYFSVGPAPVAGDGGPFTTLRDASTPGFISRAGWSNVTAVSMAFNGSIPFDPCSPNVGFFDFSATQVGVAWGSDIAEGVTFTASVYGSTRTYMPSKKLVFAGCGPTTSQTYALCMRYD